MRNESLWVSATVRSLRGCLSMRILYFINGAQFTGECCSR